MRLYTSLALVLLALTVGVAPAGAAPPPFGGVTELPICVSGTGSGGACQTGRALSADGYPESAISPDGRNLYVTASNDNSVATLAIDANGGVGQLPGTGGCISKTGT